jgi:DNA polymerase III delta prime subunit
LEPGRNGDGRWALGRDDDNDGDDLNLNERDIVLLVWEDDETVGSCQTAGSNGASRSGVSRKGHVSPKETPVSASARVPDQTLQIKKSLGVMSGSDYALGLVERRRDRDRHVQLKLFLDGGGRRMDRMRHRLTVAANQAQESAGPRGGNKSACLSHRSRGCWQILRLQASLSTSEREYIAVHSVRSLPAYVQSAILDPSQKLASTAVFKPSAAVSEGSARLNHAQERAISASLDVAVPFTLIQGPPGTGKTRTIVALVTALVMTPGVCGGEWSGARVLVCAPSNAAVDEIAMRLFEGLAAAGGGGLAKVVRVGARGQMRPEVWDAMSLDRLADRAGTVVNDVPGDSGSSRPEGLLGTAASGVGDAQSAAVRALGRAARDAAAVAADRRRSGQQSRARVLAAARVVCATLSGAGSAAVKGGDRSSGFDAVVVDEAAQAIEASALVPLPLVCAGGGSRFKCVLVGDPQQLPATVLSRAAEELMYGRSLFERLQAAGREPYLLSV